VGQLLLTVVQDMTAVDDRTFRIVLKEPSGLLMMGLAKPSGTPFMMPKRVAESDPFTQLSDTVGSGPFVFKKDEWKPGEKAVYVRNSKYRPRSNAFRVGGRQDRQGRPRRMGGDVGSADRGQCPDQRRDRHDQQPRTICFPFWPRTPTSARQSRPAGLQYIFRFNVLHKPFDNPRSARPCSMRSIRKIS
jgi:peptide/nickel transport system substrate-binding protein